MRLSATVKHVATGAMETSRAAAQDAARLATVSAGRRVLTFMLVLAIVVLVLIAWNWSQSLHDATSRLWGEILFFGFTMTAGIIVISELAARFLPAWVARVPAHEALVWALLVVAIIPVAVKTRWSGPVLLLVGASLLAVGGWLIHRRYKRLPRLPIWALIACASLALLAYAALSHKPGTANDEGLAEATAPVADAPTIANAFRPRLFFDLDETYLPVDVAKGGLQKCRSGLSHAACDPAKPSDTFDGYAYVTLDSPRYHHGPSAGSENSAYYFHAVTERRLVYLDYWWYFAQNPAPVARNVVCGGAVRWLGEACAAHPADWEGITVVVKRCSNSRSRTCKFAGKSAYEVKEVHYAQHEKVVSYPWSMLQDRWRRRDLKGRYDARGSRALVFVALDSHASYATPCERCKQIVHPRFPERYDGTIPWERNTDKGCAKTCLQPLPTDMRGAPTSWNAFAGPWGRQDCILFGSYCENQPPPRAPSFQRRYRNPGCVPRRCIHGTRLTLRVPGRRALSNHRARGASR